MAVVNTNAKYIYVSTDKRVKVIMIDDSEGVVRVSGDVASDSRPGLYHHTEIIINNGWVRFSCSCEAGAHGLLCHHVAELYNVFKKNYRKLGLKR